jgi:hypothetical protein
MPKDPSYRSKEVLVVEVIKSPSPLQSPHMRDNESLPHTVMVNNTLIDNATSLSPSQVPAVRTARMTVRTNDSNRHTTEALLQHLSLPYAPTSAARTWSPHLTTYIHIYTSQEQTLHGSTCYNARLVVQLAGGWAFTLSIEYFCSSCLLRSSRCTFCSITIVRAFTEPPSTISCPSTSL